jgi:hypothetical protein
MAGSLAGPGSPVKSAFGPWAVVEVVGLVGAERLNDIIAIAPRMRVEISRRSSLAGDCDFSVCLRLALVAVP